MKVLLDTHLLLWAAGSPMRLAPATRALIDADDTELPFSAVSLWEIGTKHASVEGATLLTAAPVVGRYPGAIRLEGS